MVGTVTGTTRCGRAPDLSWACLICNDLGTCFQGRVHEIDREVRRALVTGGLVAAIILALCWLA